MGKAQRDKGKRGELELAHKLNELLESYGSFLDEPVQRSQQFAGNSGDADVRGLIGFYIECKRVESLNVHKAYKKVKEDNKSDDIPVVMFRRNAGEWMALLSLEDLIAMYSVIQNPPTESLALQGKGYLNWLRDLRR